MPNKYNDMFQNRPMEFFKEYPVTPPASADQPLRDEQELFDNRTRDRAYKGAHSNEELMTKETVVTGNQVVWIDFIPSIRDKPGAISFQSSTSPANPGGYVPIHFLPWQSRRVVHMTIPAFNRLATGPVTDDANPNRFFTAALSGCSIFARGDVRSPEVYHGGVDGKELNDPVRFWRDSVALIESRSPVARSPQPVYGEVNREDYTKTHHAPEVSPTPQAEALLKWYNSSQPELQVTAIQPWGCVFGIRDDAGEWKFYLQENATVFHRVFHKKKDLDEFDDPYSPPVTPGVPKTVWRDRTGNTVTKEKVPRKHLPDKTVFWTDRSFTRPMKVRQFFPNAGPVTLRTNFS
jgi:hypothetical protein